MLSINLSGLVLLLALAFACGTGIDEEATSRRESPVPVQSPSGETTVAPSTATPESRTAPTAITSARETPVVSSPSPALRTPGVSRTIVVPTLTSRVTISGILAVAIGDPPGDSGRARQAASLRDASGKLWKLLFDNSVFGAPASLFDWNLKPVKVEGMLTAEPDTILVTSIAPDP